VSYTLFTFNDMLKRACPEWDRSERWKLVRHIDSRRWVPDLVDLFYTDRAALEYYQAEQAKELFGNEEGLFSFLGLPARRALFIGAYFVRGWRQVDGIDPEQVPRRLLDLYKHQPEKERVRPRFVYQLERDSRFSGLEMRVVIDWGSATRSWHQRSSDKAVVELRDAYALAPCPDYEKVDVTLSKLRVLVEHADANSSWRDRLSAVGGIYLLTDPVQRKLYVGQAKGPLGFWGRWREYAENRSGNLAIDEAVRAGMLRPDDTSLSILEVVPRGPDWQQVLDTREALWKRRLCSVGSGYNQN
jgi:hypothetical protein